MGSSLIIILGIPFAALSCFLQLIALYVVIYFSIYFPKKGCVHDKIFWVFDCLITHVNLCDCLAGYKFLVWKWFSFWILKAIPLCYPTFDFSLENFGTNWTPSSLHITSQFLWKHLGYSLYSLRSEISQWCAFMWVFLHVLHSELEESL